MCSDQSGKRPVSLSENEDEVLQDTSFAKSATSAVEERPSKRSRREDSPREEGASEDIWREERPTRLRRTLRLRVSLIG